MFLIIRNINEKRTLKEKGLFTLLYDGVHAFYIRELITHDDDSTR